MSERTENSEKPVDLRSTDDTPREGSGKRMSLDSERLYAYEKIKESIRSALEEFLHPFQMDADSTGGRQALRMDDFFPSFLGQANRFTDNCCQKLVKVIRSCSRVPGVRETATPDLAKRIRDTSFKRLDVILGHYASTVKKIGVIAENLRKISEEMDKAEAAGPNGQPEAKAGAKGPDGEEWATTERFDFETARLLQAKTAAYAYIVEYLRTLHGLPNSSVPYAAEKCFAAETSYEIEREQADELGKFLSPRLARAIETFEQVSVREKGELEQAKIRIRTDKEQERVHLALEEVLEEKLEQQAHSSRKFKKTIVWLLVLYLLISIAVLIYFSR